MGFRWKLVNLRCVLGDSWVTAADAEIVDISKETHRFQPGQDSCEAPCEAISGGNERVGGDFKCKVCGFR